jgi:tetratricopeptide (TPR) repeat protein
MKKSIVILILGFVAAMSLAETAEDKAAIEKERGEKFEAEKMIQVDVKEEEKWFKKGVEAAKTNNYDEAIKCFKKAIAINPNNAPIHYNLGIIYYDRGMLDEAITEYKKAIALLPGYLDAHYNLGITYIDKGMLDEAIDAFKKTIDIAPKDAAAYCNLGIVYDKKGMLDKAITEFKKAIDVYPNYAEAHFNLGAVYKKQGSHTLAAKYFHKAGLLFLKNGDKEWALRAYEDLKLTNSKELERDLYNRLHPEQKQEKSFLDRVLEMMP